MYIPYKNKQANPDNPIPVETVDCHEVQADVLTTDLSENTRITGLKQLKTETKVPTKAINALNEQLENAQISAADAVQRVVALEKTINANMTVTDITTAPTTAYIMGTTSDGVNAGTQVFDPEVRLTTTSGRLHVGSLELSSGIVLL